MVEVVSEVVSKAFVVICCDILLTMFMQKHFRCLVLCEQITTKKDFFDGTYVYYIGWSVQWTSTFVFLLVHNDKISLRKLCRLVVEMLYFFFPILNCKL